MLTKILHRFNGSVLFECECECALEVESLRMGFAVKAAIEAGADLRYADLRYADLQSANFRSADLRYADLQSANFRSADLQSANLRYADLRSADLRYADLRSADLRSANLQSADLRSANLQSADLRSANFRSADLRYAKGIGDETPLPEGILLGDFKREIIPQLLTAGGKSIDEVLATGCWECHEWCNCPMHVALDIDSPNKAPALLRPWVERFVQLFDAKLLPIRCWEQAVET